MRVTFRADASLQIGSGHIMRCLTLAERLRRTGAECAFICRAHSGNLLAVIRSRGFEAIALPSDDHELARATAALDGVDQVLGHAAWLGTSWQTDAQDTVAVLATRPTEWLVVDHYALDERWEQAVKPFCQRQMVIDDLADRRHRCDLLLDQNLGRVAADYTALVLPLCQILTGPQFGILRPEFSALRAASLARRAWAPVREVLITMGGVDHANATGRVLEVLKHCALPDDCLLTVVMGAAAPWTSAVRDLARTLPWPTEVVVNIDNMAERMAASDLAIGAAGGAAWERCCLGLPTLMIVLAANQWSGAVALGEAGAATLVGELDDIEACLPTQLQALLDGGRLAAMSRAASLVTAGQGVNLVVTEMESLYG